MYIVDILKVDSTGRIVITEIFETLPEKVLVVYNTAIKKLYFLDEPDGKNSKLTRRVDSKGRVCLPKWVIEELGDEFFVCKESSSEHFILPRKVFKP